MKLLIVGDCHGEAGVNIVNYLTQKEQPDAVIQCGDLWDYDSTRIKPMMAVHGNHEKWAELLEHGNKNLEVMKPWTTKSIGGKTFGFIGGISEDGYNLIHQEMMGIDWYFSNLLERDNPIVLNDYPYKFWVQPKGFRDLNIDVMITHDKVKSDFDTNVLMNAVKLYKPRYVFHGHMHVFDTYEMNGGETMVFQLSSCDEYTRDIWYCILDTDTMSVRVKNDIGGLLD